MADKQVESETAEGDLPRHVAIIMDGNGRWARKRNLPRPMGHREGVKAVRRIVEARATMKPKWLGPPDATFLALEPGPLLRYGPSPRLANRRPITERPG